MKTIIAIIVAVAFTAATNAQAAQAPTVTRAEFSALKAQVVKLHARDRCVRAGARLVYVNSATGDLTLHANNLWDSHRSGAEQYTTVPFAVVPESCL